MNLLDISTQESTFRSDIAVSSEFQCLWTRTVPGGAAEIGNADNQLFHVSS